MTIDWLISYLLWISLLFLLSSALTRKSLPSILGWALMGAFWLCKPSHYLELRDYFNVVLSLAAGLLCLFMAWTVFQKGLSSRARYWASYAAGVCGIIYFPFALVAPLHDGLINITAQLTVRMLQFFDIPAFMKNWNLIALNGSSVEIILACTAIESIALFAGVILSVEAPLRRRLAALASSAITIYILNILRNGFVLMAYAGSWFGSDSFDIAHNVIAKIGSTIALLAISYFVFMLLPELLMVIDELVAEIKHHGGDAT